MSREILVASDGCGAETRYLLEVFQENDHWTSTLLRLDESGEPQEVRVAPRFYGVNAEQARRRMLSVLENQYEEVRSAGPA